MADKISKSYSASKNIYDDVITHRKWWTKLYSKFIWKGVNDPLIAQKLLSFIDDDYTGSILDIPVGTGIFTYEKYNKMKYAKITCIDYSEDMLAIARDRMTNSNIQLLQGDVGKLNYDEGAFDIVFSMNGFHVFPDKESAFDEVYRVLKKDGLFISCFYVQGKIKRADYVVNKILSKKGWFTPPFDSEESLKQRLIKRYDIEYFDNDGAIVYFCVKKK